MATGSRSTAAWLCDRFGYGGREARAAVELADATGPADPAGAAVAAAMADARISVEQARLIVAARAAFPVEAEEQSVDAVGWLIEQAPKLSVAGLIAAGRALAERLATEPSADDPADEPSYDPVEWRRLTWQRRSDGSLALRGWLDPVGAASVLAALEPLARPAPAGPDGPDPRGVDRRQADALVEAADRLLAADELPDIGGGPATVSMTLDFELLRRRLSEAGRLDDGTPLTPAAARRAACDAQVIPLVLGGQSQPLDIGRASRVVPVGLRRAVIARDGGCTYPGCDRPATHCECHHVVHWVDGGPTSLENLLLVCGRHHDMVHRQGWETVLTPSGPQFIPPVTIDPLQRPRVHHRFLLADWPNRAPP